MKISDRFLAICKTEHNPFFLSSTTNDGHAELLIMIYEADFASSPVFTLARADQHYELRFTRHHSGKGRGGGKMGRTWQVFERVLEFPVLVVP